MAVNVEKDGPVTIVILSRPEVRNAVDRETAAELGAAFRAFESDASARVAVFTGDQGHFCAGADLRKIADGTPNRMEPDGEGPMGPTRLQLSKPVIAAITGYAVAGGLELALWCDLRVMEEGAVLGVFSRRWGVPLIDGGTVRLPRLIGLSRAMDMILTGRPVEAQEALQLSKPVIAAITGYAVAGGLELALWCDLRVMEEGAVLGVFSRRWGVPLIDGGTVRLPRLIGLSRAMDMILTGRPVEAQEALQMGLVNRVVAKGTAKEAATELAHQIAAFPQICLGGDRLSAIEQFDLPFEKAMANEFKHGLASLAKESAEGAARFAKGAGRHGEF